MERMDPDEVKVDQEAEGGGGEGRGKKLWEEEGDIGGQREGNEW
jgi:hypothetical protein